MRFTWDEAKRRANVRNHGLDFEDVDVVFQGSVYSFEDAREERRKMSSGSSSSTSRTDWARLRAMKDEDIDLSEIPEISAEQLEGAVLRVGGKPVPAGQVLVPLLLDRTVLDYFKKCAGEDYRRLMNETLKAAAVKAG